MPADERPEFRREFRAVRLALDVDCDFHKAIELAKSFLDSPDAALSRQAKRFIIFALFQQKEYKAANDYVCEVTTQSEDAGDWIAVAISATLAGHIEAGEQAFDRAIECQAAAGYAQKPSIAFMQFHYAAALRDRREYQRALNQIENLRPIYEQLQITDTTALYIRGVPPLYATMEIAIDAFRGLGDLKSASEWVESLAESLDDEGKRYLAEVKSKLAES